MTWRRGGVAGDALRVAAAGRFRQNAFESPFADVDWACARLPRASEGEEQSRWLWGMEEKVKEAR